MSCNFLDQAFLSLSSQTVMASTTKVLGNGVSHIYLPVEVNNRPVGNLCYAVQRPTTTNNSNSNNNDGALSLLLMHGWGCSKLNFTCQLPLLQQLLPECSVLVPDLLGHGMSAYPRDASAYEVSSQAQVLLTMLQKESVERVVVVAWSMAGPIVVQLVELCKGAGITIAGISHDQQNVF